MWSLVYLKYICLAPNSVYINVCTNLLCIIQISLSGTRRYEPSFSDSRTERMSALSCGACSSPPPSCPESSAQPNECIRCTVPELSAATNYTVTVTALSSAGTGASSDEVTAETEARGELATLHGVHMVHTHSYWAMTICWIALASVSTVSIQLHLQHVSKCTDWVVSACSVSSCYAVAVVNRPSIVTCHVHRTVTLRPSSLTYGLHSLTQSDRTAAAPCLCNRTSSAVWILRTLRLLST